MIKRDTIEVWGTGTASREFIYVQDAARAIAMAAEKYNRPEPVNIGSGMEIRISDLVTMIADLTGYTGNVIWDTTKPDGQPRRCLDVSRAKQEFGFVAEKGFREGLQETIAWYMKNRAQV